MKPGGWVQGAGPLPIEMLPMIKMSQKRLLFLPIQFFKHLCVQQYTRTTITNINIDPGDPGTLNLIVTNQFKLAPNDNIDLEGPGPFNLIFAKQFKWAP